MAQTLEDILSEQPNRFSRFVVWLRIVCELPINIIEENSNTMGEISVNKLTKITNRQLVLGTLAVLVIGGYAAMAFIWHHQRTEISVLSSQLQTVNDNQVATNSGNYIAATISPSENSVYLPLAKLKMNATTLNENLVYRYEEAHTISGSKKTFPAELRISTHDLASNNYSTTKQFDCSEVVYADFATPSYPMNPQWKSAGSTKLADGRIMNVYYAPSIPGCDQAWNMSKIDSKAIADSLKEAVSY